MAILSLQWILIGYYTRSMIELDMICVSTIATGLTYPCRMRTTHGLALCFKKLASVDSAKNSPI